MNTNNYIAIAVGLIYCTVAVGSAAHVVANALQGENNIDLAYFAMNPCEPLTIATSSKNVVLRIDDIQAFAWSDISERMITDTVVEHQLPVVLAVIPKNLRDDASLYETMRTTRCNIEFAIHGWDHSEPTPGHGEFAFLTEAEASQKIIDGKAVIERLANTEVATFVPPQNEFSVGAARALEAENITRVSAYGKHLFDFDTESFDYLTDTFRTAKHMLNTCDATFSRGDTVCTIMLHPQDYAHEGTLDTAKYAEYTALLEQLSQGDYTVARFSDIATAHPIDPEGYVFRAE